MDAVYQRMKDDTEAVFDKSASSEIQNFYSGQNVFITGATGFIGQCLVEKLLRGCPDIERIYVLIREKNNETVEERMKHYFQNSIFDSLRKSGEDFQEKVTALKGNLLDDGLGLSKENQETLINEIDFIFHNGSVAQVNEKISLTLQINVLGTEKMLNLAKKCKHLKGFMYVSTAFSHSYRRNIEELFYNSPADLKTVHDMIAADTENRRGLQDEALAMLCGEWPNTYLFSKAAAEDLVKQCGARSTFACGVFRPSAQLSTYKEPVPGWVTNMNGLEDAITAAACGMLHVTYRADNNFDFVPVDMTVNALLAVNWDMITKRKQEQRASVYNYGSSTVSPITLKKLCQKLQEDEATSPTTKALWSVFFLHPNNYLVFYLLHVLFHFLPALLADAFSLCRGKKPEALAGFFRGHRQLVQVLYFLDGDWKIDVTETKRVWDRLNATDRDLFFSDLRNLDWDDYCLTYWRGVRIHLLQDPLDTVEEAQRRRRNMWFLHRCLSAIFCLTFAYYAIRVFRLVIPHVVSSYNYALACGV